MTALLRKSAILFTLLLLSLECAGAENLLKNGDFSATGKDGKIVGWRNSRKSKAISLVEENGNKSVRIALDKKGIAILSQRVKLPDGVKKIQFKASVNVKSVAPGKESWHTTSFANVFFNAKGKQVGGYPCSLNYREPTGGWKKVDMCLAVPQGAVSFIVDMRIWDATGEALFDDLQVLPIVRPTQAEDGKLPKGKKVFWDEEPEEKQSPTRSLVCMNGLWKFSPGKSETVPQKGWGYIWVPGAWSTDNYFPGVEASGTGPVWFDVAEKGNREAEWKNINRAWYKRDLNIPKSWKDRAVLLDFRRICTDAVMYIDGKKCADIVWPGGKIDITNYVSPGKKHELALLVVAALTKEEVTVFMGDTVNTKSKSKKVLEHRGITGDVFLLSRPKGEHVSDVFVKPSTRKKELGFSLELSNAKAAGDVSINVRCLDESGKVEKTFKTEKKISAGETQTLEIAFPWENPRLWDIGQPNLYTLMVKVDGCGFSDEYAQPFGFREFWIEGRKFFLNGSEVRFRPRNDAINNGDRKYISIERMDGIIDGMRYMGANIQEFWPWDHFFRGTVRMQDLWYERADLKGWPVIAPLANAYGEDWSRIMKDEVRRNRNHPCIFMWVHTTNRGMHGQDQNPLVLGNRKKLLEYGGERYENFIAPLMESNEMVRQADPTRPVFAHHCGSAGDIHTINSYLSWIPLQEQEEWLSQWVKTGDMPYLCVEFGFFPPCDYRAERRGWRGTTVTEYRGTECIASYFGAKAYTTESEGTRNVNPSLFVKGQKYKYSGKFTRDPMHEELVYLMGRNVFLSWRTMGVTGGMIQWEVGHLWNNMKGERLDVAGPFKPGRRGAYVRYLTPGALHSHTPMAGKYRRGGEFIPDAFAPVVAWIVGKDIPGDIAAFTAKDHHFNAGDKVEKRIAILNDTRHKQKYVANWRVVVNGHEIASGKSDGEMNISQTLFIPFDFDLPQNLADKSEGVIKMTATVGEFTQNDSFPFTVFAPQPNREAEVLVFDPKGMTSKMLSGMGCSVANWDGKASGKLLVVGREALSDKSALPGSLESFVKSGGNVLIFSQTRDWLENKAFFRTGQHVLRRIFPLSGSTPDEWNLTSEDMRDWSGHSTLLEAFPKSLQKGGSTKYGWHWGNRGGVASVPVEKPHFSSWRPLLECDFGLAYTPLMEMEYGRGSVTLCQLDIEDHFAVDPAAKMLYGKIMEYALSGDEAVKKQRTLYLGEELTSNEVNMLGLSCEKTESIPTEPCVLVVGQDAKVDEDKALEFVRGGGSVFVLPRIKAGLFGVEIGEKKEYGGAVEVPAWSEARGLSVSDLHVRCPISLYPLKSSGDIEVSADGLLGRMLVGKGVILFCQLNKKLLDADKITYFRTTRHRWNRAMSQMLANLGSGFVADSLFFAFENKRQAYSVNSINLTGNWKAAMTKAAVRTGTPDTKPDDPGVSEYAAKTVMPEFDDSNWDELKVPGHFENKGGAWAKFDGEVVYRKTIYIPDGMLGKDLILKLGIVDDFDNAFFNGVQIGKTDKTRASWWTFSREYVIPRKLVKPGKNVVAVRVFDNYMSGGMLSRPRINTTVLKRQPEGWYLNDRILRDNPYRYCRW